MKKQLSLLTLIFICLFSFGQKAKIKTTPLQFSLQIYPEISGYENVKKFFMKVVDKNNVNFRYSEGNTEEARSADIYNQYGLAYKFNFYTNNYDLLFDVKQNSSSPQKKELLTYKDPTTQKPKFSYRISAKQNYTVKIFDVKNDNKLLKEITFDATPYTDWPGNPTATVGYGSKKMLEANYRKKQETSQGFIKKIDARLIHFVIRTKISNEIVMALHDSKKKLSYYPSYVKTKDSKFSRLDSAMIYIKQGLDLMKQNQKSSLKGNHHLDNAQKQFQLAHKIYQAYSKDEYITWFTKPELHEEYLFGISANLYFTSFLTSDFKSTKEIYEAVHSKVENEKKKQAQDNSVAGAFGSLKRTPAQKALDNIDLIRDYVLREEALFTVFKERFGY